MRTRQAGASPNRKSVHIGEGEADARADFSRFANCFRKSSTSLSVGLCPSAGPTSSAAHKGVVPAQGVLPPAKTANPSLTRSVHVGLEEEYSEITMMRSAVSASSTRLNRPHFTSAFLSVGPALLAGPCKRGSPRTKTVLAVSKVWADGGEV
jgi:hypothetical protein